VGSADVFCISPVQRLIGINRGVHDVTSKPSGTIEWK
jgi:GMP synthase PP-ATPase subunit